MDDPADPGVNNSQSVAGSASDLTWFLDQTGSLFLASVMGDGVSIQDREFRILYQNEVHKGLLGDHRGEYCYRAYNKREDNCGDCPLIEAFRDGKVHKTERSVFLNGSERRLEITASPVRNTTGDIFAGLEVVRDVTRYQDMEESLVLSEQRYRRLVSSVTDYIYTVEVEKGRAVSTSHGPACITVTGYTAEEFGNNPFLWLMMVHEADRAAAVAQAEKVIAGENVQPLEHRIIHKDGSVRWVRNTPVPRLDVGGNLTGYDGLISDITERKKAEETLIAVSERVSVKTGDEYFSSMTEFISHELENEFAFIGEVSEDGGRIKTIAVYARGATAENFEYDLEGTPCNTVVGKDPCFFPRNVQQLFPDDALLVDMAIQSYAAIPLSSTAGIPLGLIATCRCRPMDQRYSEKIISLLRIFSARAAAEIERRRTERMLRSSEEFIRNILDTVDQGFLVIDTSYRIRSANKAFYRIMKLGPQDVIGRTCHEIEHGIMKRCFEIKEDCPLYMVFQTGEPASSVHEHRDSEGTLLLVEVKAFPLRAPSGEVESAIQIITDITEKKKLEEQLNQSQKMEAVGLLAGGVAHDFNNILTAIMGYGNLLDMKLKNDEVLRKYVDQILSSSERAATLVQSLLAFSRKQIINPRPLDANEVISRVEKLLRRVIGEDIDLETRLFPEKLLIMADSGQMEQVLLNLATNARDAMPDGGFLTIETARVTVDEQFIKARGYGEPGDYVCISMIDTGMGMDVPVRERIFEPFFTTKALGKGTGLGLSMVYGAVKQNDGHIEVVSQVGKGTVFRIYFPLIKSERLKEDRSGEYSLKRGTETVMIAEDDSVLRRLSSAVLSEFGYTTIEAVDGEDAIRKFRQHMNEINIVVTDVIMPKKNGKEVYDEIIRIKKDMKFLFISGYTHEVINRKGILDPGLNFLSKPLMPKTLLKKVREILDQKNP